MELQLKLYFTRAVALISAAILLVVIIVHHFSGNELFNFFNIPPLIVSLLVLLITYKFPQKKWMPYLIPVLQLTFYIITSEFALERGMRLPSGGYILYPVYTFFLLGIKKGFIFSFILGLWTIASPFVHGVTAEVYGMYMGTAYPFVYSFSLFLCFFLEIIREKLLAHLSFLSTNDEMTGLLNRGGFLKEVEDKVNKGDPFHVVLTDVDYFTKINANLGNALSDSIIISIADLLKSDMFIHSARWYGDQFVFILPFTEDKQHHHLNVLQKGVAAIPGKLDLDFCLSFSAGILTFPKDAYNVNDIMVNVNVALIEAKKKSHGTYHHFGVVDKDNHHREITIENDIVGAILNEEIAVFFQPKVSPRTGEITGMEALSRWNHKELGNIIPPDFISAAEKSGNVKLLGEYVFDKAFKHLRKCLDMGYNVSSVSVNVSPLHLLQNDFYKELLTRCNEHSIKPNMVVLEITENMILRDEVKDLIETLQNVGFRISLDDFGTGYSSLSYLSKFSFDELKIDKSFTDKLLDSLRDQKLFIMILELSKQFDMKTVVEGVETGEQTELIKSLGADEIQGWYYSKALSSDDFIEYLKTNSSEK